MKLLLVISSLAAGGAERVMTTLANHWASAGHEVTLITTHDAGRKPHYSLVDAVRVRSQDPGGSGATRQWQIVKRLRHEMESVRPDLVLSFLNYTNILTLTAARGLNLPVIISERLDPRVIGIGPAWSLARRLTYRKATCLVAQTPTAASLYAPLVEGRVQVIPNPVPAPPPPGPAPANCIGWDRPTILCVGRLQRQKGFDVALKAMSALPREFQDWRMVILGEGPLRADIERLRDELGLADRVDLTGRVESPWPWLERAQIFVMSSRTEGFPNALCEAMSAGLAVISTDCPSGPADIITPGTDGLLVAPEDPDALAEAMVSLMEKPELRRRLAASAPRINERFSPEEVLRQWDRLISDL